ncbi:early activation antigen CD69-like [Emydura macquarii macquarii]|uniref:early activation antigen CD69-like n=1 Tax=Emydura macquarii macquarii TaxID=1129001 RepID=UPI00352A6B7E
MGKSTDPTGQSLQGERQRDLETGAATGTGENRPREQFPLMESLCNNGDARGARDPGYPSPSREPSGRKTLICVSVLAAVLIIALAAALAVEKYKASMVAQRVGCVAACPGGDWLAFQGKCYYFSEAEGNWTSSQNHCSSLGASLAGIDTQQEMDFMLRYGGPREHWIGLRNETGPHWRWVNGTEFNNW